MTVRNFPIRNERHENSLIPVVTIGRRPISGTADTDIRDPKTGKYYERPTFWRVSNLNNGVAPSTGNEGELWYLEKIVANVPTWVKMEGGGGSGPLLSIIDDDAETIVADSNGDVTINTQVIAAASQPLKFDKQSASRGDILIQYASAVAATDATKVGFAAFDSAHFSVDASGFVTLAGGGAAIDQIAVDASTGPGTNPVVPDGAGEITVSGAVVANHDVPLETHSRAANAYNIEVQYATTNATSNGAKSGVAHFDVNQFSVDSTGFVQVKSNVVIPEIVNLGITYSAGSGTFTVTSASGAALSTSNTAFIRLPDKANPGLPDIISITEDQTFIDDNGASQIINNTFGLTSGTAFNVDVPFYLYGMVNDAADKITFAISRIPHRREAPASGRIATSASAVASTQGSFYALEDSGGPITVGDYDGNPCILLGSFRMRMSASDDWTVQTLTTRDGIGTGRYQEDVYFTMPRATFGNAASSYFDDLGGSVTVPTWSADSFIYMMSLNGDVRYSWISGNATGGGVGASGLTSNGPFVISDLINPTGVAFRAGAAGNPTNVARVAIAGGSRQLVSFLTDGATAVTTYADVTTNSNITYYLDRLHTSVS